MQHKTRFTFCVFLLLLLTAGTCPAITILSYDGTQNLSPAQIPDIIRYVTGDLAKELRFKKDSLLIQKTDSNGTVSTEEEKNHHDLCRLGWREST